MTLSITARLSRVLLLLLLGSLALPSASAAQASATLPKADAAGVVAWHFAETGTRGRYSGRRWHSSLFGGLTAGWYWTGHLKTEIDFGASTTSRLYRGEPVTMDGVRLFQSSRVELSRRTLGLSQQYQFLENAWFHPHLAAGVNLTWERRREEFEPLVRWDPVRQPRELLPGRIEGPSTRLTARPFLAGGFKAYMTPRAFFRADLRIGFRSGMDESLARAGFGIDF